MPPPPPPLLPERAAPPASYPIIYIGRAPWDRVPTRPVKIPTGERRPPSKQIASKPRRKIRDQANFFLKSLLHNRPFR